MLSVHWSATRQISVGVLQSHHDAYLSLPTMLPLKFYAMPTPGRNATRISGSGDLLGDHSCTTGSLPTSSPKCAACRAQTCSYHRAACYRIELFSNSDCAKLCHNLHA